jgi:hypothetical protein
VGHASLVTHESSEMDGFLGVVAGEGFHFAAVTGGTFPRQETERAMTGSFVLTVTVQRSEMVPGYSANTANLIVLRDEFS